MALVTIPNPLTNGTTAYGSDVIANINTLASDYNGNIQDVNIAAGANIQNSKLAPITASSKVNGTSLTNLAGIPSSAGTIPTVNLPAGGSSPNSLLALSNKYVFNFTGVTTAPTSGAVYTNNSQAFLVTSCISGGAAGALTGSVYATGSSAPNSSGALVKSSGTGDATITFGSVTAQLPPLDGSLVTNTPGHSMGSWDATKVFGTIYQAATDGFVVAYLTGANSGSGFNIKTDSSATPSTVRATVAVNSTANNIGSAMCPVRKGDYWEATVTVSGTGVVFWLPLGT